MADAEHHVVLEFPAKLKVNKPPIVAELSASLPEYSVFDSGGNKETDWVTVMPVINDAAIQAHSREIKDAIAMYIEACSYLLDGHAKQSLSSEWSSYIHGEHRCFENSATGQIVEAPLAGSLEPRTIDPYFFAQFVKTTPSCAGVAMIIKHDFHDAARIRDALFRSAEAT